MILPSITKYEAKSGLLVEQLDLDSKRNLKEKQKFGRKKKV